MPAVRGPFSKAWKKRAAEFPSLGRWAIVAVGRAALTGLLLGAQLVGTRGAEIAKRVDTYATALYHQMTIPDLSNLDLSYTPPLGSP